jgi:hypothetical protein
VLLTAPSCVELLVYIFENQSIATIRVALWAFIVKAGSEKEGDPDCEEIIIKRNGV